MTEWTDHEDLSDELPEEEGDDPRFEVAPEEFLQQHTLADIATRERVHDPLRAVPDLPFGHLHGAWLAFIENLQAGDELWSFSARRMETWDEDYVHEGYALVRNGRTRATFVSGVLVIPVPDREEAPEDSPETPTPEDTPPSMNEPGVGAHPPSAEKIAAYLAARYQVGTTADTLVLRIGEYSPGLATWFAEHNVECGAFVTACNPEGTQQSDEDNVIAHQLLLDLAEALGGRFVEGVGSDPSGQWPPERSVFLFGLEESTAREIGRIFRQDAIVWVGADAVPQLLQLR